MKTVRMMKTPMKNPKAVAVSSQMKMIKFHTYFLKDKSPAQISKALQQRATDILPRLGLRQKTLHELRQLRHGMFTFQ